MKYRSDIDGLRAIAIIPVVLFHADSSLFSGGFVGVDVFFVISGYLITLIVAEQIRGGRFSILDFYERRIRRLFPALFTVLLVCSIVAFVVMLPSEFRDFGKSVGYATLFLANFLFWPETSYFGPQADASPLLHTWSLSVEEQFYLFFPLVLLIGYRYVKGSVGRILVVLMVLSLVASVWVTPRYPSAAFYLIPFRGWELLIGAIVALGYFPGIQSRRLMDAVSVIGLGLILFAVFSFDRATPFPGWHALVPCLGTALIIHAGSAGESAAGRFLSIRPLVFIGLISYSLYLWHWPVLVFTEYLYYEDYTSMTRFFAVLLAFALALLSWRYVERPFRRPSPRGHAPVFATAAVVMTTAIGFSLVANVNGGWPHRFGNRAAEFAFDLKQYSLHRCFLDEEDTVADWGGTSCFVTRDRKSNSLLWGDSFAAHYLPGISANEEFLHSNILQYTVSSCAPVYAFDPSVRPECRDFNAQVDTILRDYNVDTVILSAAWAMAMGNGLTMKDIQETVDHLHQKGVEVILIGQTPRFNRGVQSINNAGKIRQLSVSGGVSRFDIVAVNSELKTIKNVDHFVDIGALFCDGPQCTFKDQVGFYFWDNGHFTAYGSSLATTFVLNHVEI